MLTRTFAARSFAVCGVAILTATSAGAASQEKCLELWKAADVDANGALDTGEDKAGYISAAAKTGAKTARSNQLSRDEFLQYCAGSIADSDGGKTGEPAAKTEAGTAPKDLGKGDITPGTRALAEADARKKLEASGYRDLTNMKLDGKGVWSAETTVNGKRVTVQVDSQGDIVSK